MFILILIFLGIALVLFVAVVALRTPSHEGNWEMGQEQLPKIVFSGDTFTIENLRDFHWTGPFEAKPRYISDTFNISDIQTLDVVISHFSDFEGLAHIFLSFGFSDGRHVSISFETRREEGEEFSPFWGLFNVFEIIYVVGTDRDVMGVRTGYRDERVYIYKTKATPEIAQKIFVRLAQNVNNIYDTPRFYNTLTRNCTNEVVRAVGDVVDIDFPTTYKLFFPGYVDEVLYEMGVIDTSVPFTSLKEGSVVPNDMVDPNDTHYAENARSHVLRYDASTQ